MRGTTACSILTLILASTSARPQEPASQQGRISPAHTASEWLPVETLNIDQPVAILEHGRRLPLPCRFNRADATLLACNVYAPYTPPRRVVFPIAAVEAVYVEEEVYGPSPTSLAVGFAIGSTVMAAVCHQAEAGIILTCAAIGGLVGLATVAAPRPSFYPPQPRIRRRLIYRAP